MIASLAAREPGERIERLCQRHFGVAEFMRDLQHLGSSARARPPSYLARARALPARSGICIRASDRPHCEQVRRRVQSSAPQAPLRRPSAVSTRVPTRSRSPRVQGLAPRSPPRAARHAPAVLQFRARAGSARYSLVDGCVPVSSAPRLARTARKRTLLCQFVLTGFLMDDGQQVVTSQRPRDEAERLSCSIARDSSSVTGGSGRMAGPAAASTWIL